MNGAVGGASALDLADQLGRFQPSGIVVVSVGTNDAAPWNCMPLAEFSARFEATVGGLRSSNLIYVAPLGVEASVAGPNYGLDEIMKRYATAAMAIVRAHGGRVIDLRDELDAIRAQAFEPDGLHLTTVAYDDVVLPLLGRAIREIQSDSLAGDRARPLAGR